MCLWFVWGKRPCPAGSQSGPGRSSSRRPTGVVPRTPRTIGSVQIPAQQALLRAFVLTVSDSCARGEREDLSGPAVCALLAESGFAVAGSGLVADEQPAIEDALRRAASEGGLVVTTGGTGLTVRDVTPEATRAVCSRLLDGLSEQMRAEGLRETPFAVLSRGVCGLAGSALVLNLPGSPRGAVTSLRAVLPVLPHALRLVVDARAPHPDARDPGAATPENAPSKPSGAGRAV